MEVIKGTIIIIFNVQQNMVVCKCEDFCFQANGIAGFDALDLYSQLSWVSEVPFQ